MGHHLGVGVGFEPRDGLSRNRQGRGREARGDSGSVEAREDGDVGGGSRYSFCDGDCELFWRGGGGAEPAELWRDDRTSDRAFAIPVSVLRELREVRGARGQVSGGCEYAGLVDGASAGAAANGR